MITLCLSYAPSTITFVYSLLARRRRGLILGGSSLVFLTIAIASLFVFTISSSGTAAIPAALLAARILTLIPTVMALRRSRQQGQPVTWPAFQKRNRVTFLVTTAALLCTLPLDAVSSGLWILVNMAVLPTLLASAYFAGVRIIPLMAGGLVLSISNAVMTDGLPLLFIGAPASILVLSAFYWQLRRVKEHPPLDFSETKWRKWKWPIAVATVAATATVTSFLDSNWTAVLILTAIPAMWTALSAVSELLSNRLARAASRCRLVSWILFHLD